MTYFYVKTVITKLCRAVKILDDEEITLHQFVERGKKKNAHTKYCVSQLLCHYIHIFGKICF